MASFIAYLSGEFLNSFVMAKLKLRTQGKFLWVRTIGSTLVGQGVDSAIFLSIAFWGILPASALWTTIISQWLFKVVYETLVTPLTYLVVNSSRRRRTRIISIRTPISIQFRSNSILPSIEKMLLMV